MFEKSFMLFSSDRSNQRFCLSKFSISFLGLLDAYRFFSTLVSFVYFLEVRAFVCNCLTTSILTLTEQQKKQGIFPGFSSGK